MSDTVHPAPIDVSTDQEIANLLLLFAARLNVLEKFDLVRLQQMIAVYTDGKYPKADDALDVLHDVVHLERQRRVVKGTWRK
jgi:hypothetical protein